MSRTDLIAAFLARHGYAQAQSAPLAQDASFRRYLRLAGGPCPAVLMDAPPPEDVRPFLRIAEYLAGLGLSVPRIIAADAGQGLVLEEDLGDALLSVLVDAEIERDGQHVAGSADPKAEGEHAGLGPMLLDAATDVLVALHRAVPPPDLPAWDAAAMAQTALGTLLDWWWPAAFGAPPPAQARTDFTDALTALLRPVAAGPVVFTHRDYFAGNLLWLPQRSGIRRIGVLDFQSAALGHPAYDLVSLVQDARRGIPPAWAQRAVARYLAARPELDPVAFDQALAACAAQRHLRVACQWVRLAQRDGRRQYLAYGPRTWHLLAEALRHSAAAPLAEAMDRWVPLSLRANPRGLSA